ncbi:MAG TPA: glycosyltransferase family 2 protein [Candidatus Omnitrophota bacterium]|nr:glycosyltransferase family 2 protein [Candidatus Omnitrophota bacterium]
MNAEKIDISVVVPVYNSAATLRELHDRLCAVIGDRLKMTFELVFVDDSSADGSWAVLEELQRSDRRVKAVQLARNFGEHNATVCGLAYSSGEIVATMDDDLQHPPEELPKLIKAIDSGSDIAIGCFAQKKHSLLRNLASGMINALETLILGKPRGFRFTTFRAMRRQVAKHIAAGAKSRYCYITALILKYVAQDRMAEVEVEHHPRKEGGSTYTLAKLFSLASNLIVNYSAIPLRLSIYTGFAVSFGCLLFAVYLVLRVMIKGAYDVPGWASLAFLTTFLFGILFLFLGIIGEYIYRILREVSGNEPFFVKETRGF